MNNWKKYKLNELAQKEFGLVDGPFGSNLPASDYTNDGIPVIRGTNLSLGKQKFNDDEFVFVSVKTAERLKRSLCKSGDIIFTKKGTLGQIGIIPSKSKYKSYLLSSNQMKFSVDKRKADNNFVYYYLSSEEAISKIKRESEATGVPKINLAYLKNFEINIPEDLETQQRIASILSSLDDKIELNRRMNQTLEQIAATLFKKYFVDDIDPDNLPEGWKYDKVRNLFDITIGRTPPRVQREWFTENEEDVKWISIKDMGNSGVYIFETSEYLTPEAVKKFNVPVIPENTVVLSFKLTVGRVSITTEKMLSNEAIAHFKPLNQTYLSPYYSYMFLKSFDYDSLGNTSSIATAVNSQTIKDMPILIPDEEVVSKFNTKAEAIFLKIKTNIKEIMSLSNIRDTLLPKLMSGEIDVTAINQPFDELRVTKSESNEEVLN